jgi:hypothetical protein
MKRVSFSTIFILMLITGYAQRTGDSLYLVNLNQEIDQRVVNKDTSWLRSRYADDFVFSHGSGKVEGRTGWLATVGRTNYPSRLHDSVRVELHPGLAIVKGKMAISRAGKEKTDRYHLRYIRVYAWREKDWQLVSHSTTHEWHEN